MIIRTFVLKSCSCIKVVSDMKDIELWQGDCLELMNDIPDKSVDIIFTDLPYSVTQNSWDCMIDLDKL